MGNFCGIPMISKEEDSGKEPETVRIELLRQLSYDIYKIPGTVDWRIDFDESHLTRRNSKRYYEVKKLPISHSHSQQLRLSSFGSRSSAGTTATSSNWTPSLQPSSTELEDLTQVQQLHTEPSSPSIGSVSASSSESSAFESNQNLQSPPPEIALKKSAGVAESHGARPTLRDSIPEL